MRWHTLRSSACLLAAWCVGSWAAPVKTVAVVGAQGRLGRELVYQSLDRGCRVVGIVRRPDDPVHTPVRRGWLTEEGPSEILRSARLHLVDGADEEVPHRVRAADAVVFALSGKPFQRADTNPLVATVARAARDDAAICYVSAYGTGASVRGSNAGIHAMRAWYLRSVYETKQREEELVLRESRCRSVCIFRPRVLSHARVPFNRHATPRYVLARSILDWCLDGSVS